MEEKNSVVSSQPLPSPGSVLAFGILSLALCETVILGLIFGFMARSKSKKYINAGVPVPGQAKAGRALALVGIILSFVMIVFWVLYAIFLVKLVPEIASTMTY